MRLPARISPKGRAAATKRGSCPGLDPQYTQIRLIMLIFGMWHRGGPAVKPSRSRRRAAALRRRRPMREFHGEFAQGACVRTEKCLYENRLAGAVRHVRTVHERFS